MSDVINTALAALASRFSGGFDGVAKFVIRDEGAIMLDNAGVRAGDEAADVTLTADADVFRAILDRELSATTAFMTGKLSVNGNMGLAMKLGAVLA